MVEFLTTHKEIIIAISPVVVALIALGYKFIASKNKNISSNIKGVSNISNSHINTAETINTSHIDTDITIKKQIINNNYESGATRIDPLKDYSDKPTPLDIIDEYIKLTPYQKLHSREHPSGNKIKAKVSFSAITFVDKDENIYNAMFTFDNSKENRSGYIHANINVEDFPVLKTFKENQDCIIAGSVTEVRDRSITICLKHVEPIYNK